MKYGNPDGAQQMKVGIGLPRFLLQEEYKIPVLLFFFFIILVLIPGFFIKYFQEMKKYERNGLLIETMQILLHYIRDGITQKNCPELLYIINKN